MELESLEQPVLLPLPDIETPEAFAARNGLTHGLVQGWVRKGLVPSVRIGKRRLVNNVQLRNWLQEQEWN